MYLSILILQESDAAALNESICIRHLGHHITQIFMTLLPKVNINGSSKIVVSLGPCGDEDVFDNVSGVTNIFIEDFDFKLFLSLDRLNQDKKLLETLRNALIDIATKKGINEATVEVINSTADSVLETHFQLETSIKKLAKNSKDKKHKIAIFRLLNAEVGESWYCNVQGPTKNKTWMHEVPTFIDRSDFFKSAELHENNYKVKNRLGNVVFELTF